MKISDNSEHRLKLERITEAKFYKTFISNLTSDKQLFSKIKVLSKSCVGLNCEMFAFYHSLSDKHANHLERNYNITSAIDNYTYVPNNPERGDMVFYLDGMYPDWTKGRRHVGLYCGKEKVLSVWGKQGPLVLHPLDYVPLFYGRDVYFRRFIEPFRLNPNEHLEKILEKVQIKK